ATSQRWVRQVLLRGEAPPSPQSAKKALLGLGARRSLADYEAFTGVRFAEAEVSLRGLRGGLQPAMFVDGDPAAAAVK
ncbi:unnamed protein product, partial [Polarella glacialis]